LVRVQPGELHEREGQISLPKSGLSCVRSLRRVEQEAAVRKHSLLIERIRARRARHRRRSRAYRVGFAVLGFLISAAGGIMLLTPGPGLPVLIVGLTMLALEFSWAERWLEALIIRAERAVDEVTRGSPVRRAALIAAGVVALAVIGVMIVLWNIPYFPG
jgi:uncharacterized protein (TIGR02611 family)